MVAVTERFQPIKHVPFWRERANDCQTIKGRPPRETLRFALNRFKLEPGRKASRRAVDLGCGDGRDTMEILQRGWQAIAIDGSPDAIERLVRRPGINPTNLTTQIQTFESLVLPANIDLLNAGFCLQFYPQVRFPKLWEKLVGCLRAGGRFSGQLFGDRDSWAQYSSMNFHTRHEVEELLAGFVLEFFKEEEHSDRAILGEEKHWHTFEIVARKK